MSSKRPGALRSLVRVGVIRLARRLPPPRDEAALALLRSVKDVVLGRKPRLSAVPATAADQTVVAGTTVGPPLPKVPALPQDTEWRPPPEVTRMGEVVESVYETGQAKSPTFDADLVELLNSEYADKPLVPDPPKYTSPALADSAQRRVLWVHNMVDLKDKAVLEIGCGHGLEVWWMANNLDVDAHGVDVRRLGTWEELESDRVNFTMADLAEANPLPPESFDRVVSFTVWEHVTRPRQLLQETFDLLKPGGLAWMHTNLYAGPRASHRYRQIYFPWPHLLFSDDVIKEWDHRHGRETDGAAWVNRLSWDHYSRYFREIGFRVRYLKFWDTFWDEAFYKRFESVLGRFPKDDLKRDFFVVVLEKPDQ
jgi:SAM-dependent methyltransferase